FDKVLARHCELHDMNKPLVAADFDHARDTWRWVLRLAPHASLAVQVAALFHDVERLASESEARIEHRAADYEAFKKAHAAAGARPHPPPHRHRRPDSAHPGAGRRGWCGMRIVVFGLAVSSSWGNGHATIWRGLARALHRRGHHIVFFERDQPYYAEHRDTADV